MIKEICEHLTKKVKPDGGGLRGVRVEWWHAAVVTKAMERKRTIDVMVES